jgi:hypothetical protein
MPNPGVHRFARRFRDFELHRPLGLLLHDDCASNDPLAMGDIPHAKLHEIAAAQLAVDGQVEQRQLPLQVALAEALRLAAANTWVSHVPATVCYTPSAICEGPQNALQPCAVLKTRRSWP